MEQSFSQRHLASARPEVPRAPTTPSAVLRLRRGGSPFPTWEFSDSNVGLVLSIGADASCDWPITSAGMQDLEVSILFTGASLLVKSLHPGEGARLNGTRLGDIWVSLDDGARLDLGTACIEVSLPDFDTRPTQPNLDSGLRPRAAARTVLELSPRAALASVAAGNRSARAGETEKEIETVTPEPPTPRPASAPHRVREATPQQPAYAQRPEAQAANARSAATPAPASKNGWELAETEYEGGDAELSAAVLAEQRPSARSFVKRYALIGALLAMAYAGWVALLNQL